MDKNANIREMLNRIADIDYIRTEDLPNIDLYMDQVTTFMEKQLASTKRYPEDKILTKTMINNYAKNKLLPPPEKKRYSKEHLLMLLLIYYLKNILSINDIQKLLGPITEKYFNSETDKDMTYIYEKIFQMEYDSIPSLQKDLVKSYTTSSKVFTDEQENEKDQEFLDTFAFIARLSFDVYIKKMMIEQLIDQIAPSEDDKKSKKEKK
ncbi:MAG: DUF1836 domain-containing protein [Eubacteriales bacterium]|nr:DUF1836 domain-containing protein [Eubacteriales bacterium]